jgi:hypothetical protein
MKPGLRQEDGRSEAAIGSGFTGLGSPNASSGSASHCVPETQQARTNITDHASSGNSPPKAARAVCGGAL